MLKLTVSQSDKAACFRDWELLSFNRGQGDLDVRGTIDATSARNLKLSYTLLKVFPSECQEFYGSNWEVVGRNKLGGGHGQAWKPRGNPLKYRASRFPRTSCTYWEEPRLTNSLILL